MNNSIRITALVLLMFPSFAATANCAGEEIRFSFANISAHTAFSLVADFAGYELEMNESIRRSAAISFDCMHWRDAASLLAQEFDTNLRITNRTLRVSE